MNSKCDLHTHSVFSDGTWTPEQIVEESEALGLAAVALCDHNTIDGLDRFISAARGKNLLAVPGVEFSTEYKGSELHILGLNIKPQYYSQVKSRLADFLIRKEKQNVALVNTLAGLGYHVDYYKLKSSSVSGNINRSHIAAELVRQGYFETRQQAFNSLLNPQCGYYHPAKQPSALETIRFIRDISAVPVLAHPLRSVGEPLLLDFLSQAVPAGLAAMETVYSDCEEKLLKRSEEICARFSLLPSGGTDFHGDKKPDIKLGSGRGNLSIPYEYCLNILQVL